MRNVLRAWLIGAACAVCAVVVGCGTAPTCNVSPVEIEELREDLAGVQKNLATARERADELSKELATKQADLATKKGKPDELRARLEALRKGSGRRRKAQDRRPRRRPSRATPATAEPRTARSPS